jgi:hypothetical protein
MVMEKVFEWFEGVIEKIQSIVSNLWGQMILVVLSVLGFFQPEWVSFAVVFGAILADLFWGIVAALKTKKFILSKALRETLKKIGIYSFSMIGVYCTEWIIHENGSFIGVKTVAVIASACELWSMSASMLIVKPDMPFLKIFRLQLKGEIEAKLGKNADSILKESKDESTN